MRAQRGFTLIEVMIALAVVAVALMALLSLHHQSLQSVMRSRDSTSAALLAQDLMTQAELERFPALGTRQGDFENMYPGGVYSHFRWLRTVEGTPKFPEIRKVKITVVFGPNFGRSFDLIELLRNPAMQQATGLQQPQSPQQPPQQQPQGR